MSIKSALFACCLMCSIGLSAQAVANAVLNKNTVETGDTFTLRILLNNVRTEPLKVDFTAWKPFLPAENILVESDWSKSGNRWQRRYTLVAFDSAQLELPPLTIRMRTGDTMLTNGVELTVRPTRAGDEVADADAIRDIVREPTLWTDYWPWAAGALVLIVLAAWLLRKKPQPVQQVIQAPVQQQPAHETTLQQLAALEQQRPWKHGKTDQFYADLSMIMRGYLERRFKIPALESTTREILPMLEKTDFPGNQAQVLRDVLQQSDMAKFAQQPPPEQAHEKNLHNARQLVLVSSNIKSVDQHKPYSSL